MTKMHTILAKIRNEFNKISHQTVSTCFLQHCGTKPADMVTFYDYNFAQLVSLLSQRQSFDNI